MGLTLGPRHSGRISNLRNAQKFLKDVVRQQPPSSSQPHRLSRPKSAFRPRPASPLPPAPAPRVPDQIPVSALPASPRNSTATQETTPLRAAARARATRFPPALRPTDKTCPRLRIPKIGLQVVSRRRAQYIRPNSFAAVPLAASRMHPGPRPDRAAAPNSAGCAGTEIRGRAKLEISYCRNPASRQPFESPSHTSARSRRRSGTRPA